MKLILFIFLFTTSVVSKGQQADSLRKVYTVAQRNVSNLFGAAWYPNRAKIYSLNEKQFLQKIDSLKMPFEKALNGQPPTFIVSEKRDIGYFFDRLILDYPYFHYTHTGKKVTLSRAVQKRLTGHIADFNDPSLLSNTDVNGYIQSFLRHASSKEVKKAAYKRSDNKRLDATFNLLDHYFTNQQCKDHWQYFYISYHLENWGSKHTEGVVKKFIAVCRNQTYTREIDSIYTESDKARKDHLVKTYKTVDGYDLDIHLFLPDSSKAGKKPVIVYFSGGSWTEGNPEWAFYTCGDYAKKGWIAVSVEYRLADRHETTPFEAVKDARSAIRWLRMNADAYHIDTSRIVVSGNSAGGHLALATALADKCNEATDDLRYSASPDLILVNAGVYDLYAQDNTDWIRTKLKDKTKAELISPAQLVKKITSPILIVHGTQDRSVDYVTAKAFAQKMEAAGNTIVFQTIEGAPHYIWFDRRFSGKVTTIRNAFLAKYGY